MKITSQITEQCFQIEASCNSQFESVENKCHVANWNIKCACIILCSD